MPDGESPSAQSDTALCCTPPVLQAKTGGLICHDAPREGESPRRRQQNGWVQQPAGVARTSLPGRPTEFCSRCIPAPYRASRHGKNRHVRIRMSGSAGAGAVFSRALLTLRPSGVRSLPRQHAETASPTPRLPGQAAASPPPAPPPRLPSAPCAPPWRRRRRQRPPPSSA